MRKRHRCVIPPLSVPVPACFDGLFRRPSGLGCHKSPSELPREVPFKDLTERTVMRSLSETNLEEKQEGKEDRGQQWCKQGSEEGVADLEPDKRTNEGQESKGGRKGVGEDGSGGEPGDGQSPASMTSVEAVEGETESGACVEGNVQQKDEEVVAKLVGTEWEDPSFFLSVFLDALYTCFDSNATFASRLLSFIFASCNRVYHFEAWFDVDTNECKNHVAPASSWFFSLSSLFRYCTATVVIHGAPAPLPPSVHIAPAVAP